MRFARHPAALGLLVALSCQSRLGGDDGNVGETETETETIGDGDGDDGPGPWDGDVVCDLARFPALESIWIETLPEGQWPGGLAVTTDAIFDASYYVDGGFVADPSITRRSLDGQIQWSIDVPTYQRQLEWDGQHLYYMAVEPESSQKLVRMTSNGEPDASWSFSTYPEEIDDIFEFDVSGPRVLIAGSVFEYVFDGPPDASGPQHDGVTWWLEKQDSSSGGASRFGEPQRDEYARVVIPSSSGGYIAAVFADYALILRGYEGASLNLDVGGFYTPFPSFMYERPEGLLVGVVDYVTHDHPSVWMLMVNPDGVESWRKPFAPCGLENSAYFVGTVEGPEHFWAAMAVATEPEVFEGLLVEFDFNGELLATHAFDDGLEDRIWINDIASNGTEIVIAGSNYVPGDTASASWIARIQ